MTLHKKTSDRLLVEIIIKHKEKILRDHADKVQLEQDVNNIISDFVFKTGMEVDQIKVEKCGERYTLKLRIT